MTDFNFIEIERKEQVERFHKFVKEGGFLSSSWIYRSTNAYICFVVGTKGSGKTVLVNQMLKFFKGRFIWSSNIPIVQVNGDSDSIATGDEYKGRLRIYQKIRESFESVGTFEYYDDQRNNKRNKDKEIERNLSKYILEKLSKIDDGDNKKEILEAAAKGIAPLMAALIVWVTNNPSMAIPFVLFQDLINKVAVVELNLAAEKIFFFYEEWKSQNEAEHDALRNYYKDARESLRKDIRKIVSPKNKRIVVLFDDVDAMGDCAKDLGDIIRSTEGKILWVLVGKKEKLSAFKKEWSSFIMGETIEVGPFTHDEIKARIEKSNNLDGMSQVDIQKTAEAIYKQTNGDPGLVRACIDIWDNSDAKSKRSFKRLFDGTESDAMTSIIEMKLETLKASGEREMGFVNMLFFLGVLSGNLGNLLYRNHEFNNIENEILSALGGETYSRIQKDGFIYRTESGRYALQHIWNLYLMTLLEKPSFRKGHKNFINNVNRTAIHCLTEEQYKIKDKDAPIQEKLKHENWIRFEFARCYHKLWCDEEEAWRDIVKTLAVTWGYQPKFYPDFINVIQEVSKIIHKIHREELDVLRTLATKSPKKKKASQIFEKYAGSDPILLEIVRRLNNRPVGDVSDSKNITKTDSHTSKDIDGERKDDEKTHISDYDIFLISLAEIDEYIKNKEYPVAKEKINRALSDPNIAYRNRFNCKLADCYREEKKFKEASDVYQKIYLEVTSEKEKDYVVSLGLGWGFYILHLNAKNIEQVTSSMLLNNAETCFKFAVENSDQDKKNEVRIERAEFWEKRSLWDNAFSDYHMVTLDKHALPFYATIAWEGKGNIKIIQEDYITAMDCYSKASIETPNGLLNKSYIYYRSGKRVSALECTRNCRRLIQSRDSLDTILSPILFYHHMWWFGYIESLSMAAVFREKQPKTLHNYKEAKLQLDSYMIAKIEALEAWINNDDVDDDSPIVKRLRELIKEKPEIIEQIKNDRFFEYIRLQPIYHGFVGGSAKGTENSPAINSNNDDDSFLVLL